MFFICVIKVVCGGNIVKSGKRPLSSTKRLKPTIVEGSMDIIVNQPMTSLCRLLMYYIKSDGEVVADSMVLKVQEKLQNKVK